jgi:hypothetical protein
MWPISSFLPSGGDISPCEVMVRVRLFRCSVCEGVLPMLVLRFASSCGFWGMRALELAPLLAFLRRDTSAAGSSHSSPPCPIMSGTARTKLTLSPFLRVPVLKPPGPGLLPPAAALLMMSCAPGHRWARATSMRGRFAVARKAAAASFCCCRLLRRRSEEGADVVVDLSLGGLRLGLFHFVL